MVFFFNFFFEIQAHEFSFSRYSTTADITMLEIYKSYDKISATFKITPRELENKNEATDHWTFQSTEYKLKMFYIVNISLLFYNIMTDYKQH